MSRPKAFDSLLALIITTLIFSGCTSMGGQVTKDNSLTDQTEKLEQAGLNYSGPAYRIGIITLDNKTPSKVLGIGEAATTIMVTTLKQAGLEPVNLSDGARAEQDTMIELQQSGFVKTGKKDAAEGFESIDFRIAGAITSYSELSESSNVILTQTKTQIARVGVDYSLIDIASGTTVLAKSGQGEYKKKTRKVLGLGDKSSSDTGLRQGALRDAMNKAVEAMILELTKRPFQGYILDIDADGVIFKAGTRSKLDSGASLAVYRKGKELFDPETERSLGSRLKKIGEIQLSSHQGENFSSGSIVSGKDFRKGDIVKAIK